MRIELDVDLSQRAEPPLASDDATRAGQRRSAREERRLRRIALAQHIDRLVQTGQVESYAEVARVCGVSRAAVSKVVDPQNQLLLDSDHSLHTPSTV